MDLKNLKCIECGSTMIEDDCDFNFKGNYDTYYVCEKCNTNARLKVRYGKALSINYFNEDGLDVTDYLSNNSLNGSEFD